MNVGKAVDKPSREGDAVLEVGAGFAVNVADAVLSEIRIALGGDPIFARADGFVFTHDGGFGLLDSLEAAGNESSAGSIGTTFIADARDGPWGITTDLTSSRVTAKGGLEHGPDVAGVVVVVREGGVFMGEDTGVVFEFFGAETGGIGSGPVDGSG